MKAVLLAGGQGKRLAPYTAVLPKPLLPIGEMPILEVVIRQLKQNGFNELYFCVGYLGSLLEAYFGNGEKWGVSIHYSYESEPLGTAGPLGLLPVFDEGFLVMNGDLLTNLNFAEFAKVHRSHRRLATVGMARREAAIDFGVLEVNDQGLVQNYIEKPRYLHWVSMGIYIFEPIVQSWIRGRGKMDLPDLVLDLIRRGEPVVGYPFEGSWLDMGRPDDYALATERFQVDRDVYLGGQTK